MTSRSTISNTKSLHIFRECINDDICFEANDEIRENERYGDPCISIDELKEIHENISKYLFQNELGKL